MVTQEQIDDFHRFASERVVNGSAELSIDELYDLWRLENPTANQYAENVAAIKASIQDYTEGERGRPAGEFTRELRKELGLSSE